MALPPPKILNELYGAYGFDSSSIRAYPLGDGNINETFLLQESSGKRWVLQRINERVFPDPSAVAENVAYVTQFILSHPRFSRTPCVCPRLILTRDGKPVHRESEGGWWRLMSYVEHLPPARISLNARRSYQLGQILGSFHTLTQDLDVSALAVPLPGFHITAKYLADFHATLDTLPDITDESEEILFRDVEQYRDFACYFEPGSRRYPLRTIHGDPKLDNVIFRSGGEAVGLFDLDTVGPGLVYWDLGDCLRSCCNLSGEEVGTGPVMFDRDIARSVLSGYFSNDLEVMSEEERADIFEATAVITYELGLRFLTDHLRGDVYFKVAQRGGNLGRARVQFQLLHSILQQEDQLRKMIRELS